MIKFALASVATGDEVEVTDLELEKLAEPITVYNLEVEDFHTYFVGEYGVLVHNAGCLNSDDSLGSVTGYEFKEGKDIDLRGSGKNYKDALKIAAEKAGIDISDLPVSKWSKNQYGKSVPVERHLNDIEISIDFGHITNGPDVPHVGVKFGKKGNKTVIHILLDDVPFGR